MKGIVYYTGGSEVVETMAYEISGKNSRRRVQVRSIYVCIEREHDLSPSGD
jgi:hypothetical protein